MANEAVALPRPAVHTKLNRHQITGFWGAWTGWTLDGMDSVIYALVLSPALTELLPKSGIKATPATVGYAGSVLFALFLVGWGLSLIWGPIADRFGRTRVLAATIFVYAVFTGAAAMSQTVWQLAIVPVAGGHRDRRRMGVGGNLRRGGLAGRPPQDGRRVSADRILRRLLSGFGAQLHGGSAFWLARDVLVRPDAGGRGFRGFVPGEGTGTLAAKSQGESGRRAVFFAQDLQPSLHAAHAGQHRAAGFGDMRPVGGRGLRADGHHQPGKTCRHGRKPEAVRMSSLGMGLLSIGTILGCLGVPLLAERIGRKRTLAFYFFGMFVCILLSFGWAFYLPQGLHPFIAVLFFLGFFGGNFAVFSLWLPEQYGTNVRATAFAFTTSFGRFIAAGVNFGVGALVRNMGTLGKPVAYTAIAFGIGLLVIPFGEETLGKVLPD